MKKVLNNLPSFVTKQLKKESVFLKLLQWFVVSKPSKDEIDVAQQAIRLRYLMDDTIKEDLEGYEITDVSFDMLNKKAIYTFSNGKCGRITLLEYVNSVMAILNAKVENIDNAPDENEEADGSEEPDEVIVKTIYLNEEETAKNQN